MLFFLEKNVQRFGAEGCCFFCGSSSTLYANESSSSIKESTALGHPDLVLNCAFRKHTSLLIINLFFGSGP